MRILCWECSVLIEPNPANLCVKCLRNEFVFSKYFHLYIDLYRCRLCHRFLDPPNTWVKHKLESPELLKICLKLAGNFKKMHLISASFVPCDSIYYNLKIQVKVQCEVLGVMVDFMPSTWAKILEQLCHDCHNIEPDISHRAIVQVRQKSRYRKTLLYLEQAIIKHNLSSDCVELKREKDGIDFFFKASQHAQKFVNFVSNYVPCIHKESQHLVSRDTKFNTSNYKYITVIYIVPICKDDLVCLDHSYAQSLGMINNILICSRITTYIHLIDPFTLKTYQISSKDYFKHSFVVICSPQQLGKYTVVDIEPVDHKKGITLADITVIRHNFEHEGTFIVRSHLGNKLKPGDTALGFDIKHANINNENFEKSTRNHISDVILIKQSPENIRDRRYDRKWKLNQLRLSDNRAIKGYDYDQGELEIFMNELEEDEEMRRNIELHIDPSQIPHHLNELKKGIHNIQLKELIQD